jgi:hypothetical protein
MESRRNRFICIRLQAEVTTQAEKSLKQVGEGDPRRRGNN